MPENSGKALQIVSILVNETDIVPVRGAKRRH
jgi:hypothetical protein